MSKITIHKDDELEFSNVHTGTYFESAFSEAEMLEVAEGVMHKHANTFKKLAEYEKREQQLLVPQPLPVAQPQKADKRLRQYAKAVRKEVSECAKTTSISLLNKRIDLCHETAAKHFATQKADMVRLESEHNKLSHQLDLIEQELKVKPVHIKETKVLERFDHRLVIFNLVLLFLNIILLLK